MTGILIQESCSQKKPKHASELFSSDSVHRMHETNQCITLGLSFLISKMGIMIVSSSSNYLWMKWIIWVRLPNSPWQLIFQDYNIILHDRFSNPHGFSLKENWSKNWLYLFLAVIILSKLFLWPRFAYCPLFHASNWLCENYIGTQFKMTDTCNTGDTAHIFWNWEGKKTKPGQSRSGTGNLTVYPSTGSWEVQQAENQ